MTELEVEKQLPLYRLLSQLLPIIYIQFFPIPFNRLYFFVLFVLKQSLSM